MISEQWLRQQRTIAACIADPAEKAARLAELDAEEARRAEQLGKLASNGLRVNSYPGNCVVTGQRVQGGEGFVRQDKATKKWLTYSKAGAAQAFGI